MAEVTMVRVSSAYLADWLAWLAILTTVGSGEGLLAGGGGLSAPSSSSIGSTLMSTCDPCELLVGPLGLRE